MQYAWNDISKEAQLLFLFWHFCWMQMNHFFYYWWHKYFDFIWLKSASEIFTQNMNFNGKVKFIKVLYFAYWRKDDRNDMSIEWKLKKILKIGHFALLTQIRRHCSYKVLNNIFSFLFFVFFWTSYNSWQNKKNIVALKSLFYLPLYEFFLRSSYFVL